MACAAARRARPDMTCSAAAPIRASPAENIGLPQSAPPDGLIRIGEAASRVMDGSADRVLAHATNGPALQQNLVCVMEGRG